MPEGHPRPTYDHQECLQTLQMSPECDLANNNYYTNEVSHLNLRGQQGTAKIPQSLGPLKTLSLA